MRSNFSFLIGLLGLLALVAGGLLALTMNDLQAPIRPVSVTAQANPGAPHGLCEHPSEVRSRSNINLTFTVQNPPVAMQAVEQAMTRYEAQNVYANASDRFSSANIQAQLPAGVEPPWSDLLPGATLTNMNDTVSQMGPEVRTLCATLQDLARAENLLVDNLAAGADRQAVRTLLKLHGEERDNAWNRLNSLQDESRYTQVYVYLNPGD